ncbi:MAG: hypothetical protein JWN24_3933 [Phycisphaerales bacterium]|nr:hypothetical protein [Phycisphaerales bacterium]
MAQARVCGLPRMWARRRKVYSERVSWREGVYRAPLAIAAKVRIQIAASKAKPQWRT